MPLRHKLTPQEVEEYEQAQILARFFAKRAVRNTILEDYHAGLAPEDKTGSTDNTVVVNGDRTIPWDKVSRLSGQEMRTLMLQVEKQMAQMIMFLLGTQREGKLYETLDEICKYNFEGDGVSWDRPSRDKAPRTPVKFIFLEDWRSKQVKDHFLTPRP